MKGKKLKDRNTDNDKFSATNPVIEFETSARTHIFQFNKTSGTFTSTTFEILYSIDNGNNFNHFDNGEEIVIDEDNQTFVIEDQMADVIKLNHKSDVGGTPVFEVYYRATRNGYN